MPAGHAGVSFFVSSGDTGAPAEYPAVSPNVVSVGGTSLTLSSGNYGSESAWSGSGGGLSAYESQPSYQSGFVTQSTTKRGNPDVASKSNLPTGFAAYDSYNNGSSQPWSVFGGTSAAAPQWAALTAIVDQGRALAGLGSLDGRSQLLPAIYSLPTADFHDVTTGASGYRLHQVSSRSATQIAASIAAPTNVTVTVRTKTSVQVSWTGSSGARGYYVLWSNGTTTQQVASANSRVCRPRQPPHLTLTVRSAVSTGSAIGLLCPLAARPAQPPACH